MSDLLRIGSLGVSAYRGALATIGDNVANAETEGYSRRDVSLRETAVLGPGMALYNNITALGGVQIDAVDRAWDAFRATDARRAGADSARSSAQTRWLTVTETALDTGTAGVGARLTAFYTSADTLAADPNGAAPRRGMLMALDDVTAAFRTSAEGLEQAAKGVSAEAGTTTTAINNDLQALANVNTAIRRVATGTGSRAELEDERDRLLDGLNQKMSIDITLDAKGAASIRANGPGGPVLLEGNVAAIVQSRTAADGRIALSTTFAGETSTLSPAGGSMAGLVSSATAIADRRIALDSIANDFAGQINSWSANGLDKAGNPGQALLTTTGAAAMALNTSDPDMIAAAAPGGAANGNLLLLQSQRTESGAEARHAELVTQLAQQLLSNRTQESAFKARHENSLAARDEIAGIDLDREAAELLRYQQAYNGSAKVIQIARETMQSILDIF
ncbi:flagellar hook-associated protein FlgK [Sphingobium boeckii]|uniref:Flagellar hook-associated protein 1 n=1 Tax=Sphingobium boeckii TaxID=1082345 RepID=A0A7W9AIW4_9SPHN|nr:flagellar hook-associated protein FlgK [Sphingobium boeckii]MBB5686475.1 flagellar hook-associated protein 1 FlgK [Sphingobium boeckii]